MEVISITDLECGGADIEFNLSEEEKGHFASIGLLKVIKEGVKKDLGDQYLDITDGVETLEIKFTDNDSWVDILVELSERLASEERVRSKYNFSPEMLERVIRANIKDIIYG